MVNIAVSIDSFGGTRFTLMRSSVVSFSSDSDDSQRRNHEFRAMGCDR